MLSQILATGAPDIAFPQVLTKHVTSSHQTSVFWMHAENRDNIIFDNDRGALDFRRSKMRSNFGTPSQLLRRNAASTLAQDVRIRVLTVAETDLVRCVFLFRDGNLPQAPASFLDSSCPRVVGKISLNVYSASWWSLCCLCEEYASSWVAKYCAYVIHPWGQVGRVERI